MPPKKDPAEELKDAAAKGKIRRPSRTRCETCDVDCGTPLALLQHIKRVHPA